MTSIRRIFSPRPTGLPRKRTAPFWRGETAQVIIKRRLKEYRRTQAAKDAAKLRKKQGRR